MASDKMQMQVYAGKGHGNATAVVPKCEQGDVAIQQMHAMINALNAMSTSVTVTNKKVQLCQLNISDLQQKVMQQDRMLKQVQKQLKLQSEPASDATKPAAVSTSAKPGAAKLHVHNAKAVVCKYGDACRRVDVSEKTCTCYFQHKLPFPPSAK